jgi:hypothetical protein
VRLLRAKVSVCCINASGVVCSNLDVRGASCLASDNGRDSDMLTSFACYLRGQVGTS